MVSYTDEEYGLSFDDISDGIRTNLALGDDRVAWNRLYMSIVMGEFDRRTNEVRSVLKLMDELAEQWGDEGVFRRCRDRLRELVG